VNCIEIAAATQNAESIIIIIQGLEEYLKIEEASQDTIRLLLNSGIQLTIWFSKPTQFGSLMRYTTGSPAHNELLKARAESINFSYQSGTLQKDGGVVNFETESNLYNALGLSLIPPELREGLD